MRCQHLMTRHPAKSVSTNKSRVASGCHGNSHTRLSADSQYMGTRRSAYVSSRWCQHYSAQLLGCDCQVWMGRSWSEALRLSFIQWSLVSVTKSIFPLLAIHSERAESTHILLQFADQNFLLTRIRLHSQPTIEHPRSDR